MAGKKVVNEEVYSVEEFAAAAKHLFGCNRECVITALAEKQIKETTQSNAQKIVAQFLKREVKN